jgi:hypothetical protein
MNAKRCCMNGTGGHNEGNVTGGSNARVQLEICVTNVRGR